jgi:outer membrane protein assembly factor BamB
MRWRHMAVLSMLCLGLPLAGSCVSGPTFGPPQVVHSLLLDDTSSELRWQAEPIYAQQNDYSPVMAASADLTCVLGDSEFPPQSGLLCLDAQTGKPEWSRLFADPTAIVMDDKRVYVSYGGIGGVNAYDSRGSPVWRFGSPSDPVKYLFLDRDELQLALVREHLVVLRSTDGQRIRDLEGRRFIYQDNEGAFALDYGLDLWSTTDRKLLWDSAVASNRIYLPPVFADEVVLVRTGRVSGELIALDRRSGQPRWMRTSPLISNVVVEKGLDEAFALDYEGRRSKLGTSWSHCSF